MSVKDLITTAKAKSTRLVFPAEVVKDLMEVVRANDRESNGAKRVSLRALLQYLKDTHKFSTSGESIRKFLQANHNRGWHK